MPNDFSYEVLRVLARRRALKYSAACPRASSIWPVGVGHVAQQFRRIVRASGEVLHVQGCLNIGRNVHARADEGTADAEGTAEDGGVTESSQVPIEPDAVHEQRMGSEHQVGSEPFEPVEAALHPYRGRHRVAPDVRPRLGLRSPPAHHVLRAAGALQCLEVGFEHADFALVLVERRKSEAEHRVLARGRSVDLDVQEAVDEFHA